MTWFRRWRRQRNCLHHDWRTGITWLVTVPTSDAGEVIWCNRLLGGCGRTWAWTP